MIRVCRVDAAGADAPPRGRGAGRADVRRPHAPAHFAALRGPGEALRGRRGLGERGRGRERDVIERRRAGARARARRVRGGRVDAHRLRGEHAPGERRGAHGRGARAARAVLRRRRARGGAPRVRPAAFLRFFI